MIGYLVAVCAAAAVLLVSAALAVAVRRADRSVWRAAALRLDGQLLEDPLGPTRLVLEVRIAGRRIRAELTAGRRALIRCQESALVMEASRPLRSADELIELLARAAETRPQER